MFDATIYRNRRQQLKQALGRGLLLFMGNKELPMNYPGNVLPFRQDSSFLYYFGIDRPGLNAIIDIDNDTEIIFGDDITLDDVVWMGPQTPLAEIAQQVGVLNVQPANAFIPVIQQAIRQKRSVHYLPQYQDYARLLLAEALGEPVAKIDQNYSETFTNAVIAQRSIKQPEEIKEIEAALAITYEAHQKAMVLTRPRLSEMFIAGKVMGEVWKHGVNFSFPLIFTVRGEILHNAPTHRTLQAGQLVLCD